MNARVAVVILNYNGEKFLQQFLPGVIEHSPDALIVVADNGSTDGSVEMLRTKFPVVNIIRNAMNDGYAGGYNNALQQVESEYYVLLNSDVEVTPGWLDPVIAFMDSRPDVAACQPKILSHTDRQRFEYAGASGGYLDRFGYPFCRGRLFATTEKDEGQYDTTETLFWASGACLFIRSKDFHSCGGFDASFFAHMEEIDLCWRLQKTGRKIACCPQSVVYHVGGGTLKKENPHKTYLNFRNNLLMLKKNLEPEQYNRIRLVRILLDMVAAGRFLAGLQFGNFSAVIKAHFFLATHKANRSPGADKLAGLYDGSVVWQHYVRGVRAFSKLPGINRKKV